MKISVIIATFNRATSLRETLTAIERQDYPRDQFELIVINDGSSDHTDDVLKEFDSKHFLNFKTFKQQNKGPAAARNLGISHARGEIIAFTDDDCYPNTNWLSMIDETLQNTSYIGVQGRTYTDRADITPLTHQIDNLEGSKDVPTCNAAYRRWVLLTLKGFDEQFPFPHNEDADLAWRSKKIGTIGFCENMLVYHPPRTDKFKKVARRMKFMESEFRLYYKDPGSYKKYRCDSMWKNIYWEVGVKTQLYYLKNRFKFISRPKLMFQGILLTIIWWIDLMRFYPRFLRANRVNRNLFKQCP